jgi:hypothetical protein
MWICVAAIVSSGITDLEMADEFKSDIEVQIYWGVKGYNDSKVDSFDPQQLGLVEFDRGLDVSSKEGQEMLLEFCQKLKEKDFVKKVNCWIEQFDTAVERTPEQFELDLWQWVQTDQGYSLKEQNLVSFIDR